MQKTKLIETRKRKNISQQQMADALCMTITNYNRRESGATKINTEQWQKLAEILDVSLEDIYEADEQMVFIFNDNSGNIVNNYSIPLSLWESQKKYIEKLERELETSKEEIRILKSPKRKS